VRRQGEASGGEKALHGVLVHARGGAEDSGAYVGDVGELEEAAVLGLALPDGLPVGNAATVAKTFPAFTTMWSAMLEGPP